MPPAGFEPTIPAVERPQTHALDRAATGTGSQDFVADETQTLWRGESRFTNPTPLTDINRLPGYSLPTDGLVATFNAKIYFVYYQIWRLARSEFNRLIGGTVNQCIQ